MQSACLQVMCMTNGSVEIATGVLQKAGVDSLVDAVMDVAQCQAWKPAATAYQYAVWSPGFKLQPHEVCASAPGAFTSANISPFAAFKRLWM